MASVECPRCGAPVPVDGTVARAVCCVRFDVLIHQEPSDPFRSAPRVEVAAPGQPAPAPLVDASAGDRLRHLVARANFRQLWRPLTVVLAVLLFAAVTPPPTRLGLLALAPAGLVAVVLALFAACALTTREEVWLAGGVLHRRRRILGWSRTRRVAIDAIRGWRTIGRGRHDTGAKLRVDLPDGDALILFGGLDQDDEDMRWAMAHLRSGIAWSRQATPT